MIEIIDGNIKMNGMFISIDTEAENAECTMNKFLKELEKLMKSYDVETIGCAKCYQESEDE